MSMLQRVSSLYYHIANPKLLEKKSSHTCSIQDFLPQVLYLKACLNLSKLLCWSNKTYPPKKSLPLAYLYQTHFKAVVWFCRIVTKIAYYQMFNSLYALNHILSSQWKKERKSLVVLYLLVVCVGTGFYFCWGSLQWWTCGNFTYFGWQSSSCMGPGSFPWVPMFSVPMLVWHQQNKKSN